jgi:hypothetical protein
MFSFFPLWSVVVSFQRPLAVTNPICPIPPIRPSEPLTSRHHCGSDERTQPLQSKLSKVLPLDEALKHVCGAVWLRRHLEGERRGGRVGVGRTRERTKNRRRKRVKQQRRMREGGGG